MCERVYGWRNAAVGVQHRIRRLTQQVRTGTDFERRSIECVRQLRPELGRFVREPVERASFDEQDGAEGPLLHVPPMVLLGEVNADCYYHLACWNEANALVEGMQTPYRAAQRIANMRIHEPPDVYGLIPALTELVVQYEDHPELRRAAGESIVALLASYIERAPWPLTA